MLPFSLLAQIEKGNFIFSVEGNYKKGRPEYGVRDDNNHVERQSLRVGASVGYFFTNRFIFGGWIIVG